MRITRFSPAVIVCLTLAAFLHACVDSSQSPRSRPEPHGDAPEGSMLGPIDLVYVCGNRFLVSNATRAPAQVEYRVVGTNERGALTLTEGSHEDPGYSETELETSARGTVELYQDGELVASRRNAGGACGAPALAALVSGGSSAEAGSWEAPFPVPVIALHVSLLPTGKVLMWGNQGPPQLWDPTTGAFTPTPSPAWLFCAGHAFLADGRLLISGGHITTDHGIPDNTIFNPVSETWSKSNPMRRGRWYPTNTTLGNGDVLIMAGRDEAGVEVAEPEVWSDGAVRLLSSATRVLPYYPRAFLAPNGKVFYAGAQQTSRYLDPNGTGSWATVGNRLYGVRDYGSAVMYDEGKILYVGGGRTTNTAETIDLNAAAPVWQWTGSMAYPRRHLNATVLPTGEVLVTGGSSGTAFNDFTAGVHPAEVWNPATGLWTTLASNVITRVYHATSLLLPDGRVLHSGSGDGGASPNELNAELFSPPYLFKGPRPIIAGAPSAVAYGTTFAVTTDQAASIARVSLIRLGSVTHAFDQNQRFQWLSFTRAAGALTITSPTSRNITPPGHYMLFILDGNGVPSVARIIRVGSTGDSAPPPRIALTVTGRQDSTKQYMTLQWTGAAGAMVDVYRNGTLITATENDGKYVNSRPFTGTARYVYKLCETGSTVCSNEASVDLPPNLAPAAAFTASCTGLLCTFTDGSTDPDGTVSDWQWGFGDEDFSSERNPAHAYPGAGNYTVTLAISDNRGATAWTFNQVAVATPTNAPPSANFTWSCDGLTCSFTDGSTDGDGSVAGWSWAFGDGAASSLQHPSRTYASAGTYQVTLTVTDDGGATGERAAAVSLTAPVPIALSVSARQDSTTQYMTLTWTGAIGTMVDVYRNGTLIKVTENDGRYTNSRRFTGPASYVYKLCQAGTTICSNESRVTLGSAPAPSIKLSVTGRIEPGKQYMALSWTGAAGAMVDVYRNGILIKVTENDGKYTNSRNFTGAATYLYKVCEAGTPTCSNEAVVTFP